MTCSEGRHFYARSQAQNPDDQWVCSQTSCGLNLSGSRLAQVVQTRQTVLPQRTPSGQLLLHKAPRAVERHGGVQLLHFRRIRQTSLALMLSFSVGDRGPCAPQGWRKVHHKFPLSPSLSSCVYPFSFSAWSGSVFSLYAAWTCGTLTRRTLADFSGTTSTSNFFGHWPSGAHTRFCNVTSVGSENGMARLSSPTTQNFTNAPDDGVIEGRWWEAWWWWCRRAEFAQSRKVTHL